TVDHDLLPFLYLTLFPAPLTPLHLQGASEGLERYESALPRWLHENNAHLQGPRGIRPWRCLADLDIFGPQPKVDGTVRIRWQRFPGVRKRQSPAVRDKGKPALILDKFAIKKVHRSAEEGGHKAIHRAFVDHRRAVHLLKPASVEDRDAVGERQGFLRVMG